MKCPIGITVGGGMIAAALLFPPWRERALNGFYYPSGFGFVFRPPENVSDIDVARLAVLIALAVVVGGIVAALERRVTSSSRAS